MSTRVLVIDDDAIVGHSFNRILSDKGYDVSTALSGEEALTVMETTGFDVVFTDIKMPGMCGLEVTEHIKDKYPNTQVVVITGFGSEENENKAIDLGVSGFVHKPLTPFMIESIALKALNDKALIQVPLEIVEPIIEIEEVTKKHNSAIKNIGLFFASPFIALGYIIALPFVGTYMFGKLGYKAYTEK